MTDATGRSRPFLSRLFFDSAIGGVEGSIHQSDCFRVRVGHRNTSELCSTNFMGRLSRLPMKLVERNSAASLWLTQTRKQSRLWMLPSTPPIALSKNKRYRDDLVTV